MLRFMFPEETLDWYTWRIASMDTARSRLLLPLDHAASTAAV